MFLAPPKDPSAKLYYQIDWLADGWLVGTETIVTSTWAVNSADISYDNASQTATTTTVRVLGGIAGQTYEVTNHVISSAGNEDDRTIVIQCQEQ